MNIVLNPKRLKKGLWWNRNWPILEGCTPCSPACDNCFAAGYAHRFQSTLPYLDGLTTPAGKWNGTVRLRYDQLDLPRRTKKPTVFFVTERSDLFHPDVPDEYLDLIYSEMKKCPQHIFLVLSKRVARMAEYLSRHSANNQCDTCKRDDCAYAGTDTAEWTGCLNKIPPWIFHGATVENQASAEKRIPALLRIPGRLFLSCEPLLSLVTLSATALEGISWIIAGGESGSKARPSHIDWFRSLRDQCQSTGIPFFFKQWGEWKWWYPEGMPYTKNEITGVYGWPDGSASFRVGKVACGRLLDEVEYLNLPLGI